MTAAPTPSFGGPPLGGAFRTVLLPLRLRPVERYGLATAAAVLAISTPIALGQLTNALSFSLSILAVLVVVWFGGVRFGIVTTALAAVTPLTVFEANLGDSIRVTMFVPTSLLGCALVEALRNAAAEAARVTEIRLAEAERLRLAEAKLSLALEGSNVTAFQQDREQHYTWVGNPPPGFDVSKMMGHTAAAGLPASEAAALAALKQRVLDTGISAREVIELHLGAAPLYYDVYAKPWLDAEGNIVGVLSTSVDVSDQERRLHELAHARDDLRSANERLRTLADTASVFLFEADASGTMTYASEQFYDYTGIARGITGNDAFSAVIHPDDLPAVVAALAHAIEKSVTLEHEHRMRAADGSYRWFLGRMVPRKDALGRVIGWSGSTTDIEELWQTRSALRRSNAAKDEFLSLVSHELRTPITTILGNAQILAREGVPLGDAERRSALTDIADEAERLQLIIDNLLVLARAEQGQRPVFEPVVLGRLAEACLNEFRRKHPGRSLTVSGDGQCELVDGEKTYLCQVLGNLVSNALKYSPPDTAVEVSIQRCGDRVEVHVLDAGHGVGDEAEKIFDAFYRSPPAERMASGIGVGLAVCKRLVEAMGGGVWARDREGGGADIGFSLPLSPESAADAAVE